MLNCYKWTTCKNKFKYFKKILDANTLRGYRKENEQKLNQQLAKTKM